MFTQILSRSVGERIRSSRLVDLLTGPHGVDRYTELVDPTLVLGDGRARVVAARRTTPRSVTVTLAPNAAFTAAHRRSEEHTSELQSRGHLVCRLLLEKKKQNRRVQ